MFDLNLRRSPVYAIAAINAIGDRGASPMPKSAISGTTGLPPGFLAEIMHKLARAGLVGSTRGVSGGFMLAKARNNISVLEVLRAFDESAAEGKGMALPGLTTQSARKVNDALAQFDADVRRRLSSMNLSEL